MVQVNWARVFAGGLVAGLVMNASEAALHGGLLGDEARQLSRVTRCRICSPACRWCRCLR
jgi:hypothetical protein